MFRVRVFEPFLPFGVSAAVGMALTISPLHIFPVLPELPRCRAEVFLKDPLVGLGCRTYRRYNLGIYFSRRKPFGNVRNMVLEWF